MSGKLGATCLALALALTLSVAVAAAEPEARNAFLIGAPLSTEPAPIIDHDGAASPRAYGLDGADYLLFRWQDSRQNGDEADALWFRQSFSRFLARWGYDPAVEASALAAPALAPCASPLKPDDASDHAPPGAEEAGAEPSAGSPPANMVVWNAYSLREQSLGRAAAAKPWVSFLPSGCVAQEARSDSDDQAYIFFQELDGGALAGEMAQGGVLALEYRLGRFSLAGGAGAVYGFGQPLGGGLGFSLDRDLRRAYFLAAPYRLGGHLLVQPELSLMQGGPTTKPSQRAEDDWLLGVNVQFDF